MSELLTKLIAVQKELKAPKAQYNSFGKYNYRSCEDILQAARPLCNKMGLALTLYDQLEAVGARYYVRAVAVITDAETGQEYKTQAYAREDDSKKGMDAAQLTGATSSYARKYALCALFAIDDTKDADTDEYRNESKRKEEAAHKQYSAEARANNPAPLADGQRKALFARLGSICESKADYTRKCSEILGRNIQSSNEITVDDFKKIMAATEPPFEE